VILSTALLIAIVQLGYVSSIANSVVLVVLTALVLAREPDRGLRRAGSVLLALAAGSTISLLAYYRDFVGSAITALKLVLGGATLVETGSVGVDPGRGRIAATFVAWALPVVAALAVAGWATILRRSAARSLVFGWGMTVLVLLVVQHMVPTLFGFLHVPLLATPLLGLTAWTALDGLRARGRAGAITAVLLGIAIAAHGAWLQAQAYSAQVPP
jgi:hypothetical protein